MMKHYHCVLCHCLFDTAYQKGDFAAMDFLRYENIQNNENDKTFQSFFNFKI